MRERERVLTASCLVGFVPRGFSWNTAQYCGRSARSHGEKAPVWLSVHVGSVIFQFSKVSSAYLYMSYRQPPLVRVTWAPRTRFNVEARSAMINNITPPPICPGSWEHRQKAAGPTSPTWTTGTLGSLRGLASASPGSTPIWGRSASTCSR